MLLSVGHRPKPPLLVAELQLPRTLRLGWPADGRDRAPDAEPGPMMMIVVPYRRLIRATPSVSSGVASNRSLAKNTRPAMAAGISDHVWTCKEIAAPLD